MPCSSVWHSVSLGAQICGINDQDSINVAISLSPHLYTQGSVGYLISGVQAAHFNLI